MLMTRYVGFVCVFKVYRMVGLYVKHSKMLQNFSRMSNYYTYIYNSHCDISIFKWLDRCRGFHSEEENRESL